MIRFLKICLIQLSILLFVQVSFGQILGSSSNIFTSNSSSSKSTPSSAKTTSTSSKKKTTPAKPKTISATTKSKSSAAKSSNESATVKKSSKSSTAKTERSKFVAARPRTSLESTNDIAITVGSPTTGNFDDMFEQAIEEGNIARDERNYQVAERAYRRSQALKPKDGRWIYGLGNIFSDQQRWDEAEKAYRAAIDLEPNSPEAHIALSFVLSQPVSGANLSERFEEAEKLARKSISLDSSSPVAFDQLGVSLEMSGRIGDETRSSYLKAIELDPTYAIAYAHLGRLYRRNGKVNESQAAYRNAIQLAADIPTMILVAEVFQSQQKFTESEQLLRRALKVDSKNPTALYLLGRALTIRSSFDEAESVLKKSLEVSPNSFVPYSILGSLYSRKGRFDDSEKTLKQALRVASIGEKKQLAQEFSKLGDDLMKISRTNDAIRVFKQALEIDNGNSQLLNKLSNAQKYKN
jgi:tetratricopeptide (TPR) repeat protein